MLETNKLKVMLIEGEAWSRRDLQELIRSYSSVEVGWQLDTLAQARVTLGRSAPDVIYSAVQVRDGSGFDLMAYVPESAKVVFVSDVHAHAVRAFEVGAFDYLPRPLTRSRFDLTLTRLLSASPPRSRMSVSGCRGQIRIPLGGAESEFIGLEHTVLVTSVGGNYTEVLMDDGRRFETRRTIQQWYQLLPGELFVRTRRSTIVGLAHVLRARVAKARRLELDVQFVTDPLVVSRRCSSRLLASLRRFESPMSVQLAEMEHEYSTVGLLAPKCEFPEPRKRNPTSSTDVYEHGASHADWIDATESIGTAISILR